MLEVYDQNLKKVGIKTRREVHKDGLLHAVCHLWMTDIKNNQIFYQLRSMEKDHFPGFYDITCAGHIDPGETPDKAILRETKEEIGLDIQKESLVFLGTMIEHMDFDHEIAYIYICDMNCPPFILGEEVVEMLSMTIDDFMEDQGIYTLKDTNGKLREVKESQFCPHDISLVREYLKKEQLSSF